MCWQNPNKEKVMKFFVLMLSTLLLGGCVSTTYIASDVPGVAAFVARVAVPACDNAVYEARDVRMRTTRAHNVRTEVRQTCVYR